QSAPTSRRRLGEYTALVNPSERNCPCHDACMRDRHRTCAPSWRSLSSPAPRRIRLLDTARVPGDPGQRRRPLLWTPAVTGIERITIEATEGNQTARAT